MIAGRSDHLRPRLWWSASTGDCRARPLGRAARRRALAMLDAGEDGLKCESELEGGEQPPFERRVALPAGNQIGHHAADGDTLGQRVVEQVCESRCEEAISPAGGARELCASF